MRIKSSVKNTVAALFSNLITIVIGIVAQTYFIKLLGVEYLGLNGLFTNIISMLGIVELGIGSAITYNLYKPIANKDEETIQSLLHFYKKAYRIIATIIILISIIIIPFLPNLVGKITIKTNIYIIYMLFVIDIVCSYFLSYKRGMLYADQQGYIINLVHVLCLIILNILQILFLYITKNYYLYLIIKITMRIIENIIITIIINYRYSFLREKSIKPLEKNIKNDIISKVKALFFHKIAGFVISGTDNIIISKYLGIITVGLYSNYYLIINSIQTVFNQTLVALTPSIGNLLTENQSKKNYDIFKKIRFLNFWFSTFTAVSLMLIMDSFITIWLGKKYILPKMVLLMLVINYFIQTMRNSYSIFKEAAGIFYEDRFVPIIESVLNVLASIILLKYFGLAGVFMGTITSSLVLWCYSYPKYIYKDLFKQKYKNYILETIAYLTLFIFVLAVSYSISMLTISENNLLNFAINIILSLTVPNLILLLIFRNNNNFKYYLNLIKKKHK